LSSSGLNRRDAHGRWLVGDALTIVERHLANDKWMLGADFSQVDCDYGPVFKVIDRAGLNSTDFQNVRAYLDAIRLRRAWPETPKLPGL